MTTRSKPFILLVVVAVCLTLGFAVIGYSIHDAHWLNKGGAFIAACSAVAIYFQIKAEVDIETDRAGQEENAQIDPQAASERTPIQKKENEIRNKEREQLLSGLTHDRLRIVAVVVLCTAYGELLHGFGDVVLALLFPDHIWHR